MDSVPLLLLGCLLPVIFHQAFAGLFSSSTAAFEHLGRSAQKPTAAFTEERIFGEGHAMRAFDLTRPALPLRTDFAAYGGVGREALAVCLVLDHLGTVADNEDSLYLAHLSERCLPL